MSRHKPEHSQNSPAANPDKHGGGKESSKCHVFVEPGIQIDFVKDLREQQKANQDENTSHSKKILWWTKVSAALIFVYAGLTAWQGYLTRQAIHQTGKQFQIEQRPYVWTSENAGPNDIRIVKGEKLSVNVSWANYGRSPALREAGLGQIYIGSDAMQKADRWFAGLYNKPLPSPPDGLLKERVIPPAVPSNPAEAFGGFSTYQSDEELTQSDVDYILNTEKPFVFLIHVEYYDAYGNRYWDDICLSRFRSGALPHCDRHNEMH